MNKKQLIELLVNKKHHKLFVYDTEVNETNRLVALCKCDCGNNVKVLASKIKSGSNKSCGCLKKEHNASFLANLIRGKQPAHTKPLGDASMNFVYKNYKVSAKNRNLSFNIDKNKFKELTQKNCHYCDSAPYTIAKAKNGKRKLNGDFVYNGLDRIDSQIGYELNNVVTCCKFCNRLKSNLVSYDEFVKIIEVLKLNRGDNIWESRGQHGTEHTNTNPK